MSGGRFIIQRTHWYCRSLPASLPLIASLPHNPPALHPVEPLLDGTSECANASATHGRYEIFSEFETRNLGSGHRCDCHISAWLLTFSDGRSTAPRRRWRRSEPNRHSEVLAPICADRFQQQADAPAKLKEFGKASIWDRRSIIEKGTWATVPGTDTPNSAVVTACAERLARLL